MNWVKNFVEKVRPAGDVGEDGWEGAADALKIRKLFNEFMSGKNEDAKEARLNQLLPLFNRVYSNVNPHHISSRFPELNSFGFQTSRRFVKSIRKIAGNQSRTLAAELLYEFLDKKS
eukprot:Sdes_comp25403_c0_seq1m22762